MIYMSLMDDHYGEVTERMALTPKSLRFRSISECNCEIYVTVDNAIPLTFKIIRKCKNVSQFAIWQQAHGGTPISVNPLTTPIEMKWRHVTPLFEVGSLHLNMIM